MCSLFAGIIYDIIVEPPSIGSTIENGHSKPVAFLPYRVNGQYIMEGLASSFLFTIGGKLILNNSLSFDCLINSLCTTALQD
jgi:hypothetical protein